MREIKSKMAGKAERHKLHDLCHNGKLRQVKEYLASDPNAITSINEQAGVFGYTPLHEAVSSKNAHILHLLLTYGGQVNALSNGKYTPLHIAASIGAIECIKVLLQYDANISLVDEFGKTAFATAQLNKRKRAARLLKTAEIKMLAATENSGLGKAIEMLQSGQDVEEKCFEEALELAVAKNNHKSVGYLVIHGAKNVEECLKAALLKPSLYQTAVLLLLCHAAKDGDKEMIKNICEDLRSMKSNDDSNLDKFDENECVLTRDYLPEKWNKKLTERILWYMRKAACSVDMAFPVSIALNEGHNEAAKIMVFENYCNKQRGEADWHGLALSNIQPSWIDEIKTFKKLVLSHNILHTVPQNIVKMKNLLRLDLSKNCIVEVPKAIFELPMLRNLNLSNNDLGQLPKVNEWSKSMKILNLEANNLRVVHESIEQSELEDLNLSRNNLLSIQDCICNIKSLTTLDVSSNSYITVFPPELAKLTKLSFFGMKNMAQVTDPPPGLRETTSGLLRHLRAKLRNSEAYYTMKLMIVGLANQGKTTLMHRLDKDFAFNKNQSTKGVEIREITINRARPFVFKFWDFAGQEEYYATHQCFLSQRSLYLLVWKVTDGEQGITALKPWLDNLETRVPNSTVIIVGTHLDEISDEDRAKGFESEMNNKIYSLVSTYKKIISPENSIFMVTCNAAVKECKERIEKLRQLIYTVAENMTTTGNSNGPKIMGEMIPSSYLSLAKIIAKRQADLQEQNKIPILRKHQFEALVSENAKKNSKDIFDPDDVDNATKFLHDIGTILHYDDPNQDLRDLYFVNPSWLCELMAKVVTVKEAQSFIKDGILCYKDIEFIIGKDKEKFPKEFYPQYLRLLYRFQIACRLDEERVLIPSQLPKDFSIAYARSIEPSHVLQRQHSFSCIPQGFWSRFIGRFLLYLKDMLTINTGPKTELAGIEELRLIADEMSSPEENKERTKEAASDIATDVAKSSDAASQSIAENCDADEAANTHGIIEEDDASNNDTSQAESGNDGYSDADASQGLAKEDSHVCIKQDMVEKNDADDQSLPENVGSNGPVNNRGKAERDSGDEDDSSQGMTKDVDTGEDDSDQGRAENYDSNGDIGNLTIDENDNADVFDEGDDSDLGITKKFSTDNADGSLTAGKDPDNVSTGIEKKADDDECTADTNSSVESNASNEGITENGGIDKSVGDLDKVENNGTNDAATKRKGDDGLGVPEDFVENTSAGIVGGSSVDGTTNGIAETNGVDDLVAADDATSDTNPESIETDGVGDAGRSSDMAEDDNVDVPKREFVQSSKDSSNNNHVPFMLNNMIIQRKATSSAPSSPSIDDDYSAPTSREITPISVDETYSSASSSCSTPNQSAKLSRGSSAADSRPQSFKIKNKPYRVEENYALNDMPCYETYQQNNVDTEDEFNEPVDISYLLGKKYLRCWRKGILFSHPKLFLSVSVVPSTGSRQIIETRVSRNLLGYRALAFIVDHIRTLIKEWYPGLSGDNGLIPYVKQLVSCPICTDFGFKPPFMFDISDCYKCSITQEYIVCSKSHIPQTVSLRELCPDIMFMDLPASLQLNASELIYFEAEDYLLGSGQFGKVYEGTHRGKPAAIKLSNFTGSDDDFNIREALDNFYDVRQEVIILSKVKKHPYVISFLGVSVRPKLCSVMELARQGTLRKAIKGQMGHIERIVIYRIAQQISSALLYLHQLGIVHRDLKSDNVLVFSTDSTSEINAKLTDFGAADFMSCTGLKFFAGTPGFVAPEILEYSRKDEYTAKVDVYSFAMVLYESITKRRPFQDIAEDVLEISRQVKDRKRPIFGDIPSTRFGFLTLTELMLKAWDQEAMKRPSSYDIFQQLKSPSFCLLYGKILLGQVQSPRQLCFIQENGELWICCDDKSGALIIVVDLVNNKIKTTFTPVVSKAKDVYFNIVSIHVIDKGHVAIILRSTNDYVHLYSTSRKKCIESYLVKDAYIKSMTVTENYVIIGCEDGGFLRILKKDFIKGRYKEKSVLVNERRSISAVITSESCVFIGCDKYVYKYALHFKQQDATQVGMDNVIRANDKEHVSKMMISPDGLMLFISFSGSSIVTCRSVETMTLLGDVDCSDVIKNLLPDSDVYDQRVTCFSVQYDTLWIGTGSGHVLIYEIKPDAAPSYITWLRPYNLEVRCMMSCNSVGPNSENIIVTIGKELNPKGLSQHIEGICPLDGSYPIDESFNKKKTKGQKEEKKNEVVKNSEFERKNVLLIWDAVGATTLRRVSSLN